jgi:hypothetical protein
MIEAFALLTKTLDKEATLLHWLLSRLVARSRECEVLHRRQAICGAILSPYPIRQALFITFEEVPARTSGPQHHAVSIIVHLLAFGGDTFNPATMEDSRA